MSGKILRFREENRRQPLQGRVQHVIVNQQSSKTFNLNYGVPQGSCLGPVLFLLYASRLFEVVKKHLPSVHGYADDTQLYVSFRPDSFAAQDQAIKAIENCIADVRAWLVSHRLMFNDSKTEFLIIGSSQQLSKVTMASIKVVLVTVTFNALSMLEIFAHGLITICL